MGPSGCGKSTLLSILGCILSPDEGVLEILGSDVTHLRPQQQARFRRERIGFIFQQFHLFNGLTALENVGVVFDLLGTTKRFAKQESAKLLELVGLADRAQSAISHLSMGQRQRVAIARAMAANPDLILADEPTASLDAESGQNAMKIIKGLCRQLNKTAIIVTHDYRITSMADRILYLEDGHIKDIEQLEKTTRNVKEKPDLEFPEITSTFRAIKEQIQT
jgi:putative ABC transport system ATP-binding protein